ncbi:MULTISPECIES: hypothetical protein [Pseudomonas]|uniref:Uncharacterized protein n=1 Tax=Pseudomonas fluorescens TaxID=294 RepID=A0A161Z3W5_PSEFL|nr:MULTISPECIES: hypothetical protein [Pseudomonas]KZN15912.1 hypothetical protein A1D17_06960 [Pseudomonas fluorescens]
MYLIDGQSSQSAGISLRAYPQGDTLNAIFQTHDLVDGRLVLSEKMFREFDSEIEFLMDGLRENRLAKQGWTIDREFRGNDTFQAMVGGSEGQYRIDIAAGTLLVVLSTAIELCALEEGSTTAGLANQYRPGENSIHCLFPGVQEPDEAGFEALGLALDACLLLYFHELAHAIHGHCDYIPKNNDEARALESDADFNAGTMFGVWVWHLPATYRKPKSEEDMYRRLIRASYLLGTLLKAMSARSAEYHHPTNRIRTFLGGGVFAFDKLGRSIKFDDVKAGDDYWEQKIISYCASIKDALGRSTLKAFQGTEIDIEEDRRQMEEVTAHVLNRLKDGPLMHFKLKI